MSSPAAGRRSMLIALASGALLLAAGSVWGALAPDLFFPAYLFAFLLWVWVPFGALALLLLHHAAGGRWGGSLRRPAETSVSTLPLFVLLFVPLLFGLPRLYPWARPGAARESEALARKRLYLNRPFFLGRQGLYFAVWLAGSWLLQGWSRRSRGQGAEAPLAARRARRFSGAGLVGHVVIMTFAVTDWVASLEPEWYSTVFGLYLIVGQGLSGMAALLLLQQTSTIGSPERWSVGARHDQGNLLLTLVVLHAYLAFSQGYIIWIGNLPHTIEWYEPRVRGGWGALALGLMAIHFALPFLALLFRWIKRDRRALLAVVSLVVVARVLETTWVVLPSQGNARPALLGLAALLAAGIGGLWVGVLHWIAGRRPEGERNGGSGEVRA